AYLGVSKDTVYTWVTSKGMPGHKVGRFWKFKKADVDTWVRTGGAAASSDDLVGWCCPEGPGGSVGPGALGVSSITATTLSPVGAQEVQHADRRRRGGRQCLAYPMSKAKGPVYQWFGNPSSG